MLGLVEAHTVAKPWGYERWIANGDYCGKELFFFAGRKCSFHYHKVKDETFFVQRGALVVRSVLFDSKRDATWLLCASQQTILRPGNVFHVPPLTVHQIEALEDSVLIEVSTHHEDADSIRLQLES